MMRDNPQIAKTDAACNVNDGIVTSKGRSEDNRARSGPIWLIILVPCCLLYTGLARARDLPPLNIPESSPTVEGSLFDPNPMGVARAQALPPSNTAERPSSIEPSSFDASFFGTGRPGSPSDTESSPVIDAQRKAPDSPFDARSIGTARAQYVPQPNPAEVPVYIQQQHAAFNSYGDADSLGNRNAYVDGTFAPFSGIYESGVRFRLLGNASWYKFVTSEDTHTLGDGRYLEGAFLAGYGVYVPGFNITWLVGPSFAESVNQGAVTDRWGARAALEMYATPTNLTMGSVSVAYSTVTNNLQAQAKLGLKIFGDLYFGPETKFTWQKVFPFLVNFSSTSIATTTAVSPQEHIATIRVGGHISAVSIGPALFSLSGGWAHDRQLGSGYYGSVSFYQPF
jgi:cellulose biosynthesis protein BcsS